MVLGNLVGGGRRTFSCCLTPCLSPWKSGGPPQDHSTPSEVEPLVPFTLLKSVGVQDMGQKIKIGWTLKLVAIPRGNLCFPKKNQSAREQRTPRSSPTSQVTKLRGKSEDAVDMGCAQSPAPQKESQAEFPFKM